MVSSLTSCINVPVKVQPFAFPQDVNKDEKIQVVCGVKFGDEPIHFEWFKDHKMLKTGQGVVILNHPSMSLLIINSVNVSDSGNYTCLVRNKYGEDSHTCQLLVKGPPEWKDKPVDVSAELGENVSFKCSAYGYPPPTVEWWKMNEGLQTERVFSTGRVRTFQNGSLHLYQVTEEDRNSFMCKVSNGIDSPLTDTVQLVVRVRKS
ncbi:cell adhesion molecule DSCAM-like [Tachypleus tridentatus]|uniref:cell adhesion molecule DSCAM-like n=1 Tax=Tachypleus tridentatus TaxID=6853 RepID=UPI003FD2F712